MAKMGGLTDLQKFAAWLQYKLRGISHLSWTITVEGKKLTIAPFQNKDRKQALDDIIKFVKGDESQKYGGVLEGCNTGEGFGIDYNTELGRRAESSSVMLESANVNLYSTPTILIGIVKRKDTDGLEAAVEAYNVGKG